MEFGWRLKELRASRKMSLRALARRTSFDHTYLWRVENREHPGTVEVAQRCDEALGSATELADLARASEDAGAFGPNLLRSIRQVEGSDVERRSFLMVASSSVAASATGLIGGPRAIGAGDVAAVRDMTALFSRADQRHGGGHARNALTQYLMTDVLDSLTGRFRSDVVRRQLFSAAGEAAYLVGWMSFDDNRHEEARRAFALAVELATEADDSALVGHVLRAMAHQANDLGHVSQALRYSSESVEGVSYWHAGPKERALMSVVHARALVSANEHQAASRALLRAEDDLASASTGDTEPDRVFFFGEAALAHETASALRDMNDYDGAIREFERSVEARKAQTFTRTHAITLGYLADVQARNGDLEAAGDTWSQALDAMNGVRSGRTRKVIGNMIEVLDAYQGAGGDTVAELRLRANDLLSES